jgi:prepilin-type N-terminal cleavage/methylation domain-containing protein
MKHNPQKQRGLSLIQIMVVLAVVGIVLSMAATQLSQHS